MQDVSMVAVAAAGFLAIVVWRWRPLLPWGKESERREELKELKTRIEGAKTDLERALLLCEAGARMRSAEAKGMYLRALRSAPGSVEVIGKVVTGLSHKPRTLESILWRQLGSSPWTDSRAATLAMLDALRLIYEGPRRNAVRAKALAFARDALDDGQTAHREKSQASGGGGADLN